MYLKNLIAVIFAFASSLAFSAPMSELKFTENFVRKASSTLNNIKFRIIQPLQIYSKDVNGYEANIFLNNAYSQYTSNPENLKTIIDSHISSIKLQHLSLASQSPNAIFAVIKSADYLTATKNQLAEANLADKDIDFVYEKINDDLYCFYVFDSESGMQLVTTKDLEERKIDVETIRSTAIHNLSKYFEKNNVNIRRLENTGNARIFTVSLDDSYEASILLLENYWNKEIFNVEGEIITFVPARNVVIVTGSQDTDGVRIAAHIAESGFNELGYAISQNGYKYESGNWTPYKALTSR
jgi:uncharacterized protein YtpQ (UPF0354 family)